MKTLLRSALLFLTLASPLLAGEGPSPSPSSVDDLVREGLAKNAEIAAYEARVAEARGERTQAGAWKNPEVSLDYGTRSVNSGGGGGTSHGSTQGASLAQTFEFPGKGSLRKAVADRDVEIAELGLRQFRAALEGRIRRLAVHHAAASEGSETAGRIGGKGSELAAVLRQRPLAGPQQTLELGVIENGLVEIGRTAKGFAQEKEEARLELNALLGRPASLPLAVRPAALPAGEVSEDRLVLAALDRNLLLRTRQAEIARAAKKVAAARLDVAPNFAVGPFFSRDKAADDEKNYGGSLAMTLPLWDWNRGNIAAAKARESEAAALVADARRKVESEVVRRVRAYRLARAQLDAMPPDLAARGRDAFALADREYRSGGVALPLYLETQRSVLAAQKTRNEALLEAWDHLLDLGLLVDGDPLALSLETSR